MARQRVLVTGATGYIGGRLVPKLLDAGHSVRCLARSPEKLDDAPWVGDVEVAKGDLTDARSLEVAMESIDVAYFLVHSMGGSTRDFAQRDRQAAEIFRDAANKSGVQRIVYLGGLGRDDDPTLSPHLQSRHEVGKLLADGPVPVTELRAAVIIGSGSASFEMLRYLVEVLPVMVTPKWVDNRCQPIAIRDVLTYLVAVLEHETTTGRILEIGGPDVLTYKEMMRVYAEKASLPTCLIIRVPVLTPRLSSYWIGLVTPLPTGLVKPLVESLINEVVIEDRPIAELIAHQPISFNDSVELALQRAADMEIETSWSDASLPSLTSADPLPTDPDWAGGSLFTDERVLTTTAPPEKVFDVVVGLGGRRGWYGFGPLWQIRGLIDKLLGGVGLRRGRRHPDKLWVGDAIDFWRVEAVERNKLLRLQAEMKLPGRAWMEWRIERDGEETVLQQRAIFYPKGLFGRAYWYSVVPFHFLIFKRLAARLVSTAEAVETR